jgi:hypothetical protein
MKFKRLLDVDMMMCDRFKNKQRHTMKCYEKDLAEWIDYMVSHDGTIIHMTVEEIMVEDAGGDKE